MLYITQRPIIFFMHQTADYPDYTDSFFLFYFFLICVNPCNLWTFFQTVGTGPGPAPTKNKWRELMRRGIGCFTSYDLKDYFFSSLPLPPEARRKEGRVEVKKGKWVENERKLELSSASLRNWGDGMVEYWNDGMASFGRINACGEGLDKSSQITNKMSLYDHEGTRGLAPLSILGQLLPFSPPILLSFRSSLCPFV